MAAATAGGRAASGRQIGEFMARRKKVYEGKAKILYEGPEPGTLVQYFKDDGAHDQRAAPRPARSRARAC